MILACWYDYFFLKEKKLEDLKKKKKIKLVSGGLGYRGCITITAWIQPHTRLPPNSTKPSDPEQLIRQNILLMKENIYKRGIHKVTPKQSVPSGRHRHKTWKDFFSYLVISDNENGIILIDKKQTQRINFHRVWSTAYEQN